MSKLIRALRSSTAISLAIAILNIALESLTEHQSKKKRRT